MSDFIYCKGYKFPEHLKKACLRDREEYFNNIKLKHSIFHDTYQEVLSYLKIKDQFPIVLLSGSSGAGKTVLCHEVHNALNKDCAHKSSL